MLPLSDVVTKKYDGSWPRPRRIGRREVQGISVGFGMDVSSRGQFHSREKNAFHMEQGIRLNTPSPQ